MTIEQADYVIKGNAIFTACSDDVLDGFIAVKANRIVAVATRDVVEEWIGPETKVYDFEDRLIVPGFHDSHIHPFLGGLQLDTINLEDTKSEEEAVLAVYKMSRERTEDWLLGFGWGELYWDKKVLPNKKSLDQYFPDRPVCLFNEELHGAWVNSKALELCNITKDTKDPEGGRIKRDKNGEPTGYLLERAIEMVTPTALKMSEERVLELLNLFLKKAREHGITSMSDLQIFNIVKYESFKLLEEEGELTARINFVVPLTKDIKKLKKLAQTYTSDRLTFSGAKEFIDGTAACYTAHMLEPYSDDPNNTGLLRVDKEYLKDLVIKADKEGVRVRLHACGDGAVRFGLDCFEAAQRLNGVRDARHTIEHIENIHESDLPRFNQLGVIASVQPDHLQAKVYENHPFHTALGAERIKLSWPFKSLQSHGAKLASGTDFPITDLDPMQTIYRAVTRLHEDELPVGGWNPQEKLTIPEVLKSYTLGSAYQDFREKDLGTLEIGKFADIVVLDRNLFKVNEREIRETKVILTMMDGQVVHEVDVENTTTKILIK